MVFYFGDKPESFADLWKIIESTGLLTLPSLFDSAISIGLAVQACYLAEVDQKVKAIGWVIESFAKSMDDFRAAVDAREGGGKGMMAMCADHRTWTRRSRYEDHRSDPQGTPVVHRSRGCVIQASGTRSRRSVEDHRFVVGGR